MALRIAALVHYGLFRFELLACLLTTDQVSKPPEGQPAIKSCKSEMTTTSCPCRKFNRAGS
jgi:hypothetical protein